jgi:hypothetical protein
LRTYQRHRAVADCLEEARALSGRTESAQQAPLLSCRQIPCEQGILQGILHFSPFFAAGAAGFNSNPGQLWQNSLRMVAGNFFRPSREFFALAGNYREFAEQCRELPN